MRIRVFVRSCLCAGALACSVGSDSGTRYQPPVAAASPITAEPIAEPPGPERQSGSFVALTYNVAGLPEYLSRSRPSVYMPQIGKHLNRYDLVLLQESWQTPDPNPLGPLRCYHEMLVAAARHRYKTPSAPQPFGDDPRRPSALLADGLNVFSKLPLLGTQRVMWNRCVNTFNDCYALKGFSMTPMQLAPDAIVHVYNLHMEAGWTREDDDARDAAIDQLLAFIDQHSKGVAVIVGGDFNLRGDRERTTVQLAKIRERAGLSDACVQCARPRNVDKLLYRGSDRLKLEADAWKLETDVFRTDAGDALSDHAPLAVRFRWAKRTAGEQVGTPETPPPTRDILGATR